MPRVSRCIIIHYLLICKTSMQLPRDLHPIGRHTSFYFFFYFFFFFHLTRCLVANLYELHSALPTCLQYNTMTGKISHAI